MLSGFWLEEFEPVPDHMDFKMRCGKRVQRSFMRSQSEALKFGDTEKLRLVRIPYKGAGFSMIVAIPRNEHEDIREYSCFLPIDESSIGAIWAAVAMDQVLVEIAAR